jgi:branched-chain amino acid transport system permease protein
MGYALILAASAAMFGLGGLCIGFAQSRTNSFFIIGGVPFAIGAYVAAVMLTNGVDEILLLAVVAFLCCALAGIITCLMTSLHDERVLDLVGIALLLLCAVVARSWYDPAGEPGTWRSLTNGGFGLGGFPAPVVAGIAIAGRRMTGLLFAVLILAGGLWAVARVDRTLWGISLQAMRDDRLQAALDGHRVARRQIELGALVGGGLGLCGVGYALIYGYVDPLLFGIENAIGLCLLPLVCPIGGVRTRAIVGSVVFIALPELLRGLDVASPNETYVRNLIFLFAALAAATSGGWLRPLGKAANRRFARRGARLD